MLNYWRTTGDANGGNSTLLTSRPTTANNPLILPDGPFFDLEFTLSNHIHHREDMREIELSLDAINETYKPPSINSEENPVKPAGKFGGLFKKPNSPNAVVENKLVRVKFDVKGPLISLFARDCSISETNSEKLGKEILQKYLNILKPLYVRVEKMKVSGQLSGPEMAKTSNSNLQAGSKVVRKHLGKSRSTSQPGNRRDDSLLEVQDGIEGAILHCKRSFNSNRERELSRSVSDACCEKSLISCTPTL
ncbi:putative membrane-associated kinase regulator 2 [Salvia divinorum]|uniref:Membrane-associated kinase regulator 2 n=1 Tax=Salvia divinorum TaxID=28513 RepID=A0ABD1IK95_SALDI